MFVELDIEDIVVLENVKDIKVFKSINSIASHYNIPLEMIKHNIRSNKMYKMIGRGVEGLESNKTGKSIICMDLQTAMRL